MFSSLFKRSGRNSPRQSPQKQSQIQPTAQNNLQQQSQSQQQSTILKKFKIFNRKSLAESNTDQLQTVKESENSFMDYINTTKRFENQQQSNKNDKNEESFLQNIRLPPFQKKAQGTNRIFSSDSKDPQQSSVKENQDCSQIFDNSKNIMEANVNFIMNNEDEQVLLQVLKEIDETYLTQVPEQTLIQKEFSQLPKVVKVEHVAQKCEVLEKYNKTIGQKLSQNALNNYDKFSSGLNNIESIYTTVEITLKKIQSTRKFLAQSKRNNIQKSIEITTLHRKKQKIENLLTFLQKFQKKFGMIYKRLNPKNQQSNLVNAHEIIPILKKAKQEFLLEKSLITKFICLQNLDTFLEAKMNEIKNQIIISLEKQFLKFEEKKYFALLKSYYHLQISEKELPKLSEKYSSFILDNIKNIIKQTFVNLSKQRGINLFLENDDRKLNASKLIHLIPNDNYIEFFQRLFHEFSIFLYNTHLCSRFHENNEKSVQNLENKEFQQFFREINLEYLSNRKSLFQKIENKLSKFLKSSNHILYLSPSDLLQFLDYLNKFIEICEGFSLTQSKQLKSVIQDQLKKYFYHFHEKFMMDLKFYLIRDDWKRLPLPSNHKQYSLINLIKNFPQNTQEKIKTIMDLSIIQKKNIEDISVQDISQRKTALSSIVIGNPFNISNETSKLYSNKLHFKQADKPLEDLNELDQQSDLSFQQLDKNDQDKLFDSVYCNTSMIIIKGFEQYLKLMDIIRSSSFDIFLGMSYTIEYYIYAIVNIFCNEYNQKLLIADLNNNVLKASNLNEDLSLQNLENQHDIVLFQQNFGNLKQFFVKISDYFESYKAKFHNQQDKDQDLKVKKSQMNLFDLTERGIATESLSTIIEYFSMMRNLFIKFIPDQQQQLIIVDYIQTFNKTKSELQNFLIQSYFPSLIKNSNSLFQNIPNLKWDIKDIQLEQSNIYTERLIYLIKDQKEKLKCLGGGSLPPRLQDIIMRILIANSFKLLVESYSKIKKCNSNGRNVMFTDFQDIMRGLSNLIDQQEHNYLKDYVEKYILVWNKTAEEILQFILQQKQYPLRVLITLLNTSVSLALVKKSVKKDFLLQIEKEYQDYLQAQHK